ncbi:PAS domain-containing hybrid sensor histidine kinase/response regulator [Stenotrophomonas sp.]|jgi:two-component system sensor histidine kinase EvgS|uniref:PAS domain-containing hybrid sensor histidine kinase/response regulator n=1 Tax=Stenotrophomonas TaxID=40323 RepID=UPI000300E485|nr:PAS domain-containing hybrid sensor histidine kinase/response regulator [Stenotrophomonas sp.]MBD3826384.1 response regulator [Stenotrophomonas sp.]
MITTEQRPGQAASAPGDGQRALRGQVAWLPLPGGLVAGAQVTVDPIAASGSLLRWAIPLLLMVLVLLLMHAYGYWRLHREAGERHRAERRLQEVCATLPAVVYQAHRGRDGVLSFPYITGDMYSLFGLSAEVAMADESRLFATVHPDDQAHLRRSVEVSATHLTVIDVEFRACGPQGWRWVRSRGQPMAADDDSVKWSGYWIDVTASHEQATALAAARRDAEAAAAAKANFLATMSHEIRTPMSGMLGMLEVLEDTGLDEEQCALLATVHDAASLLRQILDDVLDYSRIDAGALPLEATPITLPGIIGNVQRLLSPMAANKGLWLRSRIDPRVAAGHCGDGVRLRQILFNLLSNALKFTAHGGVRIELDVRADEGDRQRLCLAVIDTGIGVSADQQAVLFSPFTQAEASIGRRYGGSGLGLSICRGLAGLMDGDLRMHSSPGQGTRMELELTLPIAIAPGAVSARDADAAQPVFAPGLQVLVAEDDPIHQALMAWRLRQLGLGHTMAAQGEEALRLMQGRAFDLVITDCQMPVMDGYALASAIRRTERASGAVPVPIVGLTASVQAQTQQRCQQAGMDRMLTKPITLEALREHLAALLTTTGDMAAAVDPVPCVQALGRQLGSVATAREVLTLMQTTTQADLSGLIRATAGGDAQAVNACLHRMAGGLGVVGARRLGKQARGLMRALEEAPLVDSRAGLDRFSAGVERYLAGLRGVEFS